MDDDLKFEVGSTYENMKGLFTVVSVHDENMVIRWNDGAEIDTSMVMQRKIIDRITKEREVEKIKNTEKLRQELSANFGGFKESDFKNSSKSTTWRGRTDIGNPVIRGLRSGKLEFNSWAVSAQPEVQWMDIKRHNKKDAYSGIAFFARVNHDDLYYGISVQFSSASDKKNKAEGWDNFNAWLSKKENENWLRKMALDHDLTIHDASKNAFVQRINAADSNWELEEDETRSKLKSLSAFMVPLSDVKRIDLRIEKVIIKEEALSKGGAIVKDISALFNCLMPIYRVAPTSSK